MGRTINIVEQDTQSSSQDRAERLHLGKIERRDQMRVANILTNLDWKKAGQKQHQGKRQVVWIPIYAERYPLGPPPKLAGTEEVQQPETQSEKKLSTSTIPSIPDAESENKLTLDRENPEQKKDTLEDVEVQLKSPEHPSKENSEAAIPWLTYPYQSKDVYTLKNRALKVKARILDCSTKGELVSLYAQGLITASEVKWLGNNLLSQSQCVAKPCRQAYRLCEVEATVQTNLFEQDERQELKAQTTKEIRRIGWGKKQGLKCIKEKYGVSDRALMSIEQLVEFRNYLRTLPTFKS